MALIWKDEIMENEEWRVGYDAQGRAGGYLPDMYGMAIVMVVRNAETGLYDVIAPRLGRDELALGSDIALRDGKRAPR